MANTIRFFKLPLILTDQRLYAGAITQFMWVTKALETRLREHGGDGDGDGDGGGGGGGDKGTALVAVLTRELFNTNVTKGYEDDLRVLYGEDWIEKARDAQTAVCKDYVACINTANPPQLVAAAFILYGALVIGGGKSTQAKVKRIFPACDHVLFDVAEDMQVARKNFRETFDGIGKRFPELRQELVIETAAFMGRNNALVLSVRATPFWWWKAVAPAAALLIAIYMSRVKNRLLQL